MFFYPQHTFFNIFILKKTQLYNYSSVLTSPYSPQKSSYKGYKDAHFSCVFQIFFVPLYL